MSPHNISEFRDRHHAGELLADALSGYAGARDTVILALPRGGVPVAYEVAKRLGLPFDVFTVRKLGVPGHEELAMGAIASGGVCVVNDDVISRVPNAQAVIDEVAARELSELERRELLYRGQRPALDVTDQSVIIVDDGLATGATMRAAVLALRQKGVARIVVAVPVAAIEALERLKEDAEEVVCAIVPAGFCAVGQYYRDFAQTTDTEVGALLAKRE